MSFFDLFISRKLDKKARSGKLFQLNRGGGHEINNYGEGGHRIGSRGGRGFFPGDDAPHGYPNMPNPGGMGPGDAGGRPSAAFPMPGGSQGGPPMFGSDPMGGLRHPMMPAGFGRGARGSGYHGQPGSGYPGGHGGGMPPHGFGGAPDERGYGFSSRGGFGGGR
tara:strand:- start:4860 stop:5351 length:492 start_codon:yes stop_codon:yes gene_type:complete